MCSHLGAVPLAPAAAPPCFGGTQPGTYLIPRQLQPIGCTKGGTASCERRGFYFKGFVCGASTRSRGEQANRQHCKSQGGGHMQVAEFNVGFFLPDKATRRLTTRALKCFVPKCPPLRALARPQTALKVPDARRPVICMCALYVCTEYSCSVVASCHFCHGRRPWTASRRSFGLEPLGTWAWWTSSTGLGRRPKKIYCRRVDLFAHT